MDSVFVDSNIFVHVMMNDPDHAERSIQILTKIEEGRVKAWTSTLVLGQVFSHLRYRRKYLAIDTFYDFLQGSPINVTETTRADIELAKKVKDETDLPWRMWDDLVIASQMERLRLSEIYSNDRDFDSLKNLRRLF